MELTRKEHIAACAKSSIVDPTIGSFVMVDGYILQAAGGGGYGGKVSLLDEVESYNTINKTDLTLEEVEEYMVWL